MYCLKFKCIDKINISLNATDAVKYDKICHSVYGERAFDIMLDFAKKCVQAGGNVALSVVDVIGEDEIAKAKEIAEKYGVDASAMTTKKEIIAAIDAAREELPTVGGAGDVVD